MPLRGNGIREFLTFQPASWRRGLHSLTFSPHTFALHLSTSGGSHCMIVLHAGVCDDQLLLWGETPAEPQALAPKRNGRKSTKNSHTPGIHPQPLPYDAGSESLVATLQEAGLGSTADRKHTQPVIAWLPTIDNQPVASSPLIAEPPQSRKTPTVVPWTVTALPLTTAQAVGGLCARAGKPMLAPGVGVGQDVLFWATGMRVARGLVGRQQV